MPCILYKSGQCKNDACAGRGFYPNCDPMMVADASQVQGSEASDEQIVVECPTCHAKFKVGQPAFEEDDEYDGDED